MRRRASRSGRWPPDPSTAQVARPGAITSRQSGTLTQNTTPGDEIDQQRPTTGPMTHRVRGGSAMPIGVERRAGGNLAASAKRANVIAPSTPWTNARQQATTCPERAHTASAECDDRHARQVHPAPTEVAGSARLRAAANRRPGCRHRRSSHSASVDPKSSRIDRRHDGRDVDDGQEDDEGRDEQRHPGTLGIVVVGGTTRPYGETYAQITTAMA